METPEKEQGRGWRFWLIADRSAADSGVTEALEACGIAVACQLDHVLSVSGACEKQSEIPDLFFIQLDAEATWEQVEAGRVLQNQMGSPVVFLVDAENDAFTQMVTNRPATYFLTVPLNPLQTVSTIQLAITAHRLTRDQSLHERQLLETKRQLQDRIDHRDDELRQAVRSLEEQRKQLHDVLHTLKDGIFIVGPDRRVLYANLAASLMLEENTQQLIEACVSVVDTQHQRGVVETVREDGGARSLKVHGVQGRWEGAPAVLCCRDITERRRLEDQVIQSAKMESVARLSGGIAHDFNNLLTTIIGYTELLEGELTAGSEGFGYAQEVKDAVQRAKQVSDKLQAFSRRTAIKAEPVSINEFLSDEEEAFAQWMGPGISLRLELGEQVPCALADLTSLEQVFRALLYNAQDAMPDGGEVVIRTRHTVQRSGHSHGGALQDKTDPGYVHVEVQDTGVGIPEAMIDKVFEPFFTTKLRGQGSGLGLSSVWGIVAQLNGRVEVRSVPGEGSTFHLFFPAELGAIPADVSSDEMEVEVVTYHEPSGEQILVVEDEPAIRALISNTLDRAGYNVHLAANGLEALEKLRELDDDPSLVISDLLMPVMNGIELAIKMQERYVTSEVLFITGHDANLLDDYDFPYGRHVLRKPFGRNTLLNKVGEMLSCAKSR